MTMDPFFDHEQEARLLANWQRNQHPELGKTQKQNLLLCYIAPLAKMPMRLIFASPSEFHGRSLVTSELKEHSKLTARWISAASLLNAITNQPMLWFAFRNFGNVPALICSLTLNLIIIKFTNDGGTAVAGRKSGNRFWSYAGAIGLIGMSTLQSIVAGIGTEAMLNGPELSRRKASELILTQQANLERFQINDPTYEAIALEYETTLARWNSIDRDANPEDWQTLYVRLFGTYEDRNRDWSVVPTDNLPLEKRVQRLRDAAFAIQQQAEQDWQENLVIRQQIGDDLVFLKQEMPDLFIQHFEEDFEMKSGIETVRLATESLFEKIVTMDLAGAGFPMFFMVLSLITSGAACCMTFVYASRTDNQMSRDERVRADVLAVLDDLRRAVESK